MQSSFNILGWSCQNTDWLLPQVPANGAISVELAQMNREQF